MDTGLTRALSVIARPKDRPSMEGTEPEVVRVAAVPTTPAIPVVPAVPVTPPENRFRPTPERVQAHPVMGQTPTSPVAVPSAAPSAPVAPQDQTAISLSDANTIYSGLQVTLGQVDTAAQTGWTCAGTTAAEFYQARVLRDRLAQFLSSAQSSSTFTITKNDLDVAQKVLGCSNQATGATPNTNAYIALGVIVAGAAIFLSLT